MQIRKINLNKRISAVIFGGGTENFASLLSGARKAGKNYPLFDARHFDAAFVCHKARARFSCGGLFRMSV